MSAPLQAWLDELPGETRGVIARGDRFERLIIHREGDPPEHRLGARCVGRVTAVERALGGAFVDLGAGPPHGFLPLGKAPRPTVGAKVEVAVAAEPRERKGPTLRLVGPAAGEPRLLSEGPSVAEHLAALAPDVSPEHGLEAIRASLAAEEAALAAGETFPDIGVDLMVQRTRALIAVDVDFVGSPGRDPRRARARANVFALAEAARHVRLRSWGGLICIDLVGTGHDGPATAAAAREAFGAEAVLGPLSRFGLLQLAVPWRTRPVEEVLGEGSAQPSLRTRAIALVRQARMAELSDRATPRWICVCNPEEAEQVGPLLARLGPRFALRADPDTPAGAGTVREG